MRQLGLLGAALSAALLGSYLTWTSDYAPPSGKSQVPVYGAAEVSKIVWKTEDIALTLLRKSDAHGDYLWVEVEEDVKTLAPTPTPEPIDGDAPADPVKPTLKTVIAHKRYAFLANPKADDLWQSLSPLYALRALTGSDPQSDAFGLDAINTTLTVYQGERALLLELGGQSYGTRNQYLRYNNAVFLAESKLLRPLHNATSRLVDKRTQPLQSSEVLRFNLSHGDIKKSWTHINPDDRKMAFWAERQSPDQADELATGWIAKVLRLRAESVQSERDLPPKRPVFQYSASGKETWTVKVFESTEAEKPEYYAHSDYSRGWVKLSTNQMVEILEELTDLNETEK